MSDLVDDYLRIMRSLNPDPVLLSRIESLEVARMEELGLSVAQIPNDKSVVINGFAYGTTAEEDDD